MLLLLSSYYIANRTVSDELTLLYENRNDNECKQRKTLYKNVFFLFLFFSFVRDGGGRGDTL